MSIGPSFLGGAQSRLLPMSVPFRFFVAACLFHVLFWVLVGFNADLVTDFEGGLGPVLGAVHVLTLGVLVMAAIGASLQLLPVATRRAPRGVWPVQVLSVLFIGGVPLLVMGMAGDTLMLALVGGALVSGGLLIYVTLLGETLFHGKGLGVAIVFSWAALFSLVLLAVLGMVLIGDFQASFLNDHMALAGVHFVLAIFGFMGLLAFGFSFILIPMFALSASISAGRGYSILGLTVLALALAVSAIILKYPGLFDGAFVTGLLAGGLYVQTMLGFLKTGMRKRLGIAFVLIRTSWGGLILALVTGAGIVFAGVDGLDGANVPGWTIFGWLVLAGWLLTFLIGILLRITPFLSSMHSTIGDGRPARLSSLTPEWQQKVLVVCHPLAVLLVAGGIVSGQVIAVEAGALTGLISAIALLAYVLDVIRRLIMHRRAVA